MNTLFPKNINTLGRVIRLLAGVALLALAIIQTNWIYFAFALFCFFEALMSWCIVYHILGINDCNCKKDK